MELSTDMLSEALQADGPEMTADDFNSASDCYEAPFFFPQTPALAHAPPGYHWALVSDKPDNPFAVVKRPMNCFMVWSK